MGAVAGGARRQVAVEPRALRIVHERRLFAVADQAPLRRRQPLAGDQRRQYGRWRRLVGRHRAADLGMRMPRKPGGHIRRRPQRELRDDPYVRVGGERLHHIGREAGAGGQLLPALDDWICREEACPLRAAGTLVEQGERGVRLCHGIDVGGGQPALVRKPHSALLDARGQRNRLRMAEVRAIGEVRGDVGVRDRDQPVDQLGRQGRIGGEPAQDMVHRGILPGSVAEWLVDFAVVATERQLPYQLVELRVVGMASGVQVQCGHAVAGGLLPVGVQLVGGLVEDAGIVPRSMDKPVQRSSDGRAEAGPGQAS